MFLCFSILNSTSNNKTLLVVYGEEPEQGGNEEGEQWIGKVGRMDDQTRGKFYMFWHGATEGVLGSNADL